MLQDLFSNIGVHERGKPVELRHADTEMALMKRCASGASSAADFQAVIVVQGPGRISGWVEL